MKLTRKLIAKELVDWAREKKDDGFNVTIDYKENSRTLVHPRFPIYWFDPYDGDNPVVYISFKFPNNCEASIIYHQGSFGFNEISRNAYELAVLYEDRLCYDIDITDDVIGYLTLEDLDKYLEDIKNLVEEDQLWLRKLRWKNFLILYGKHQVMILSCTKMKA